MLFCLRERRKEKEEGNARRCDSARVVCVRSALDVATERKCLQACIDDNIVLISVRACVCRRVANYCAGECVVHQHTVPQVAHRPTALPFHNRVPL